MENGVASLGKSIDTEAKNLVLYKYYGAFTVSQVKWFAAVSA